MKKQRRLSKRNERSSTLKKIKENMLTIWKGKSLGPGLLEEQFLLGDKIYPDNDYKFDILN